jgi:hypothetical protein
LPATKNENKIFNYNFFLSSIANASNFEIKVAISLNDCIKCSNYLYSLNSVSKKYKITLVLNKEMLEDSAYVMEQVVASKIKNYKILVSDSLYKLYTFESQNYISTFKNNIKI